MEKFLTKKPKAAQNKMELEEEEKPMMPWVEKYRPNNLDQISYQEQVTESLKSVVRTGNLPHLLLYGPAGTGKTSAIIALAKQLYGPVFYKDRIKQLNASDQRGIAVVRNKIKTFAQKILTRNPDKRYPCPDFKIIILDEADLMTKDAQSALRRIIQDNSDTTRFCIICNFVTKIIEPLASRCVKFKFKPIPQDAQLNKLKEICQKEKLDIKFEHLETLMKKGDLRQTINALQAFSSLPNLIPNIFPIQAQVCRGVMNEIHRAKNIGQIDRIYEDVKAEGYALDDLISGLVKEVLKYEDERRKAILLELLSDTEQKLLSGASDISVYNFMAQAFYVINAKIN